MYTKQVLNIKSDCDCMWFCISQALPRMESRIIPNWENGDKRNIWKQKKGDTHRPNPKDYMYIWVEEHPRWSDRIAGQQSRPSA